MNDKVVISISAVLRNETLLSLQTKLEILRRFDAGETAVEIAKSYSFIPRVMRTIRYRDKKKSRHLSKSMTKMEFLLVIWIYTLNAMKKTLSKKIIQEKARELFYLVKNHSAHLGYDDPEEMFESDKDWFSRFINRSNLQHLPLNEERFNSKKLDPDVLRNKLQAVIDKGDGYADKNLYNIDLRELFRSKQASGGLETIEEIIEISGDSN